MSNESQSTWPVLPMTQRRILGVMVEKAKTTPDVYPLSVNALMTGCNQKSNRDPVLSLDEDDVAMTLDDLMAQGLVTRIETGRVNRWRHNLYEKWTSNKVELAILAELLLRGPQTEGELRGRASRMEPIEDLDVLRRQLQPMKERGLIVFLGPEGRRGTQLTHGFHDPQELEHLRSRAGAAEEAEAPAAAPSPSRVSELAQMRSELNELKATVSTLGEKMHALAEELRTLKQTQTAG